METFFSICFKTGILFTVVSFALGQIFGGETDIELDADFDADVDFQGGGRGLSTITPLKPSIIAAFVTVFGGVGLMVLNRGFSNTLALIIGGVLGFIVAFGMFRLVILPLHKRQTITHSYKSLVGHIGKVILPIRSNQMGRIRYVVDQNTYTAPAKSLEDEEIQLNEEVVIVRIEKNVFYVSKLNLQKD